MSSATGTAKTDGSTAAASLSQYTALWDLDGKPLDQWIKSVPVLFPKASASSRDKMSSNDKMKQAIATVVWNNLRKGLDELQAVDQPISPSAPDRNGDEDGDDDDDDDVEDDEDNNPNGLPRKSSSSASNKRQKTNDGKAVKRKTRVVIHDPYNLWLHTLRRENDDNEHASDDDEEVSGDDLKTTSGGKLSQLTVSGILNGLAGIKNGLVKNKRLTPVTHNMNDKTIVPSLQKLNVTFGQLKNIARTFYKAMQTRMEKDVLVTTPLRIQQMLAPEFSPSEFKAVRKRIYDTVVLGKGLAAPNDEEDIPTASGGAVHDIEKFKKCKTCGNNDQSLFVLDRKNGDVICSNCGTVASESLMHEGSQFRKFEGEVDRNHHGDAQNPLYSNAHNMSTTLGGVQITTGAGIGGFGSQKKGLEVILRNAHAYTELNISQFGKGDRRTRTGYKDKQKKGAFIQMAHCGDALNLHEAVVQRAKELFAGFRDDRELVQQFKAVIAACLCEAFDQLSTAGRQILKQQEEDVALMESSDANGNRVAVNARAHRRNELHHANLAGRGGLLLDFEAVEKPKTESDGITGIGSKPCSQWDLDDCRTWLLEASRSIAAQWIEERKKGAVVPEGSQEELEGKLVEHAITLCDLLEAELKVKAAKTTTRGRRAVTTPRVTDMAKLGIRWQHAHERGSGGKGGVGNSGTASARKKVGFAQPAQPLRSGPSAGQLLILKTAQKLGAMLKDQVSGNAIHKELRILVGRQEALKRKQQRDEATRQRLLQMKRKSWLQARVDASA